MNLTPHEVYDLHYWEFNQMLMGYVENRKQREKDNVALAYQIAGFNNSKKRLKPLQYYINKIDKAYSNDHSTEPVDVEKSKNIMETIERLKREKGENVK